MENSLKRIFAVFLKGAGMGAADVIPGVSGGTIAFITGIYEELIDSIQSINIEALKKIINEGLGSFWKHINGNFLVAVFSGILLSVFTLAKLLQYLLEVKAILVWSFFFGLIIASAIYIARSITKWTWKELISIIAGTVIAFFITILTPAETSDSLWFVFLTGVVAICAMILPGISGAFILLLMGKYSFMIQAITELNILVIIVFGLGAVIGLLSFSNILSWLLHHYKSLTIALLSGFMVGSLNKVWPWKVTLQTFTDRHGELKPLLQENVSPYKFSEITGTESFLIESLLLIFSGFLIVILFEIIAKKKKT